MGDIMCACNYFKYSSKPYERRCHYLSNPYVLKRLAILLSFFSETEFEEKVRYRTSMAELHYLHHGVWCEITYSGDKFSSFFSETPALEEQVMDIILLLLAMLTAIRTPKEIYYGMIMPLKALLGSPDGLELMKSEVGRRYRLDLPMCNTCFKADSVRQLLARGRNHNGADSNKNTVEDCKLVKQKIIEDETGNFVTVQGPYSLPATSKLPDPDSQTVVNESIVRQNATKTNYCPYAIANYSAASLTAAYVANLPVANAPVQPCQDEPSSCMSDSEDPDGVFISLKKFSSERRKKTKDKILRLVKLIDELDLDPDEVRFSVTTK